MRRRGQAADALLPAAQIGQAVNAARRVVPIESTRRVRFDARLPGRTSRPRRRDAVGGRDERAETEASSAPIRFTYRP